MDIEQVGATGRGRRPLTGDKVTVKDLDWWIGGAQPGARLLYYSGYFAGEGSEALNEALRAQEERGMIFLVQQKRPRPIGGADYLAVRSSRPVEAEKPARVAGLREQVEQAFGRRR